MIELSLPIAFLHSFTGAFDFILHQREAQTRFVQVGGLGQVWELTRTHLEVSGLALAGSLALALPVGAALGHRGRGEMFAIGLGNAGRAVPELAVIGSWSRSSGSACGTSCWR